MELQYKFSTRKKGRGWQLILAYKDSEGWHQKTKSGFESKREALMNREELLEQVKGIARLDRRMADITLREFADFHLKNKPGLQFNSIATYRSILQSLPGLLDMPLRAITYMDIVEAVNAAGGAPRSRGYRFQVLKSLFTSAVRYKAVTENPLDNVRAFENSSSAPRRLRTFTREELQVYIDCRIDHPGAILLCICALTGIRGGEALGICWSDIDLPGAELSINKQYKRVGTHEGRFLYDFGTVKNKHGNRVLHMPPILCARLSGYRQNCVLHMDGRLTSIVSTETLNQLIKAATPGHSVHDFRHTFATTMLARGVDIMTVAALLGDTLETVAKTYVHYTQEMRDAASRAIDEAFG